MAKRSQKRQRGYSLVELIVAMALATLVLAAAMMMLTKAMDATAMVTQRAEMQQNARTAISFLSRDLSLAATGFPQGGIQLPTGAGSTAPKFACNAAAGCYLAINQYPNALMTGIVPNPNGGPMQLGVQTRAVTVVYLDNTLPLNTFPLTAINAAGTQITFAAGYNPPINDPVVGLQVGDVLYVQNANGTAVGEITGIAGNVITFGNLDPLNVNQSGAAAGNVKSLANPSPPAAAGTYPQTSAYRLNVITYFIQVTAAGTPRLMRQVNAQQAVPIADNIENLQLTFDIFDDNTGVATANLPDANNKPNQIRQVNIAVTARTSARIKQLGDFQRLTLGTSVVPRNLSFRDRYQ
ncbi:MAG TPA: prepilin-type N-terminal cleavage/methylation domain-containing protein [Terriglobales bacterium]|nr:prepilin-type N-terminal cleavage/methylation domain-containing protein [Terriglobales bacterium]